MIFVFIVKGDLTIKMAACDFWGARVGRNNSLYELIIKVSWF